MRSSTAKKTRKPKSGYVMKTVKHEELTEFLNTLPSTSMLHIHLLNRALYDRKTGKVIRMVDVVYHRL